MPRSELAAAVAATVRTRCAAVSSVELDPGRIPADADGSGMTALVLSAPPDRATSSALRERVAAGRLLLLCTQELCHQVPVCIKGVRALDLPPQPSCACPRDDRESLYRLIPIPHGDGSPR